jgi:hypothetical protein
MAENTVENNSSLSFKNSEIFRNNLVTRNLKPYVVEGAFSADENNRYFEYSLSDQSPKDSEDLSKDVFAEVNEQTKVNVYGRAGKVDGAELLGPNGGAVSMQQAGTGNLQVEQSEQQVEYSGQYAELELLSEFFIDAAAVVNRFAPPDGYVYTYYTTEKILSKDGFKGNEYPNFTVPNGSLLGRRTIGTLNLFDTSSQLSSDSYLGQISSKFLDEAFQERVSREVEKNTIGKVNLQAFSDVFSASLLASGQQSLIAKNYTITVPDGVFDQAAFLLQRFSGTYIPTSPIEGEYFQEPQRQKTKAGQLISTVTNKFTKPATPTSNPSIKFLNNTGSGQKNVLFTSLGYNRFKPEYEENTTQVGLVVDNVFNKKNSLTNFYVGTETNDPFKISSPPDLSPVDAYGNQTNTIVFGPDALAKEYEGNSLNETKFGLNSSAYIDDQNIPGGFTWLSTKNSQEAGQKVGQGGETGYGTAPSFEGDVASKYNGSKSTQFDFRKGSILDETQRLINSVPANGPTRLQHAGNAINQVSKVFHDGYKEMTKGSKVRRYVTSGSSQIAKEYGRVFAKDIPYMQYQNLQSDVANEDGTAINGNIRKFTYSVLDATYNLNIAPTKGQESTNINETNAKKYMFSIENLAWRNTPEFEQLPACEKGPNGGRVMWFPPYELKVGQETSNPLFNKNSFLGRPEPIYTYESTERTGSISWTILVDHPSVSDLIVKKVLQNESSDNTVTQVMASFFAGLKKYDIYEIARTFSSVKRETLEQAYQEILQTPSSPPEAIKQVQNEIGDTGTPPETEAPTALFDEFINHGFYFPFFTGNEAELGYTQVYDNYLLSSSAYTSPNSGLTIFFNGIIQYNYNRMVELRTQVIDTLVNNKGTVTITLDGTKVLDNSNSIPISTVWSDSVIKFFRDVVVENNKTLFDYEKDKKLIFKKENLGTLDSDFLVTPDGSGNEISCLSTSGVSTQYSIQATACRAIRIANVIVTPPPPQEQSGPPSTPIQDVPNQQATQGQKPQGPQDVQSKLNGISKKIIRELLTESDYFEVIKKEDSFLYENIRKKFKFFNPAFHSMTPEGLNSRLVFLNQCVRPGRTIPTKQENLDTFVTDSFNTNFGTPPILILRVGDFYNTKIVPSTLTISYEDTFDLNPEGIGVQPMVAKINLGFNMIGGHGLAKPVERLQNALSFNYYANTEMYDERAEETESTEAVDKAVLESIRNEEPLVKINNVNDTVQNEGGTTLGTITNSTPSQNGIQTGTIQYKTLFGEFLKQTKGFFELVTNSYISFVKEYNVGIWSQVNREKYYNFGFVDNLYDPENIANLVPILGKPGNWETSIGYIGNLIQQSINVDTDSLALSISGSNLQTSVKNKIKENYKQFVQTTVNNDFISVTGYIQKLTDYQVGYANLLAKMDVVSNMGDGKILANGSPKGYLLSGTMTDTSDTFTEFRQDYGIAVNYLNSYSGYVNNVIYFDITYLSGNSTTYNPSIPFTNTNDNNNYTILSNVILDSTKRLGFIDSLVNNVQDEFYDGARLFVTNFLINNWDKTFLALKTAEVTNAESLITNPSYKDYQNFNPLDGASKSLENKERVFDFTTENPDPVNIQAISNIYDSVNTNNDINLFNGKKQFNN